MRPLILIAALVLALDLSPGFAIAQDTANIAAEPDGSAEDEVPTNINHPPSTAAPQTAEDQVWALTFTTAYIQSNLQLALVHNEYGSEEICKAARKEFLSSGYKLTGDSLPLTSMQCTATKHQPDLCSNCDQPSPFPDGQVWTPKKESPIKSSQAGQHPNIKRIAPAVPRSQLHDRNYPYPDKNNYDTGY